MPDQGSHECACIMPKGIWQRFDFNDSHPDLPSLYLRGGSILPVGQPVQYVGETNPTDELSLLISLDENGKAEGVLYEDDGDGYGYTQGNYLLTYYSAEIVSSNLTVKVSKSEGSYKRPKRPLLVKLLLGGGAMIDARGIDGEELHLEIPSESQVVKLVSASEDWYRKQMKNAKNIPSEDGLTGQKGFELSKTPVELKSGDWALKVVPWIGGRIVSMNHLPSGTQWLHSRVEIDGYEEYSGIEYRSAGCSEEYKIIGRDLEQSGEEESLGMEGDIGGGLIIQRIISIVKRNPKILRVDSSIIARNVGAGSGGFSRLVCLRIHPTFTLLHPTEVHIAFTSIDGSKHEIFDGSQELSFEGNNRPNGEWMLVDRCAGLALVNRFDLHQVNTCMVEWGAGTVNLELWSEERPVSIDTPLEICHEYEVRQLS